MTERIEIKPVGIEIIDHQHNYLAEVINEALQILEDENSEIEANYERLVENLVAYSFFHFYSERRLMELTRFVQAEEHEARHEELKAKINAIHRSSESAYSRLFRLVELLRDWVAAHTCGEDGELAEHLLQFDIEALARRI